MPFSNIEQPKIIEIEHGLRLKRFDGNIDKMVEGYHDPVVYQNSEGIFNQDEIPDVDYIKGMCKYLENVGEFYFIQVLENGEYTSVGDVTVKAENPPIAIWQEKYRGVGIGAKVMKAVIDRLSVLGYKKIAGTSVFKWNTASQRMHERLGFCRVGETVDNYLYEYVIKEDYMTNPICTYEDCAAFVERFYGDVDFCDPMLTNEEQLSSNLLNAFRKPETHRVFGVYRADRLVGLFAFLVLPEEQYAEMLVGLSRDLIAYRKMLSYLEGNLLGYDVDFVFNPRNHLLRGLLAERNATFEVEEQKMIFGGNVPDSDTTGVELFSDRYAQQYFDIHNKNMYWTGEKVAAAPERFRTFLAIEDGQVVGYMDVTHSFEENEPFDLFVLPGFRGKGHGRKLLTKAIQMNAPKGMMLLVEVDNEPAIRLYESAGFVKADGPNYLTAHWKVDSSR